MIGSEPTNHERNMIIDLGEGNIGGSGIKFSKGKHGG
jgi:hypothetical protein